MANLVEKQLIDPLVQVLQQEKFVILTTIDPETGAPNVNAISWVYAKDVKTIVFAVEKKSKIAENIMKTPDIVISLIANESIYSISGEAVIKNEMIEGISLKLTLIEMNINEVREVMFYGSKITVEPQYEKTYDKIAADKLDHQVMDALKKA